ncbi:MAG: glycosyltransferase [Pseudomonadota bacterium]|uniref:glycosyltransferase n=1 Tax=Sphingobium sp. TaxID=1912891 RepID=UPI002E204D47
MSDKTRKKAPPALRKLIAKVNRARGRYKSAGVPVSAMVHGLISKGNAARSAKRWEDAARHFGDAVTQAPHLAHIWVQLGHMHKQLEHYDLALDAYARAEALDPSGEGAIEQGRVARLQNKQGEALQHFMRAYHANRGNADALTEILNGLERRTRMERQALAGIVQGERKSSRALRSADSDLAAIDGLLARARALDLGAEQVQALQAAREKLASPGPSLADWDGNELVFDASDLIEYFAHNRLPTGIQRVQIATIADSIRNRPAGTVKVSCFSDQDSSWTEVSTEGFMTLCRLALESGDRTDPEWIDAYTELKVDISLAPPLKFQTGAFLVNLGTSWWLRDYFLFVREAKRAHGVRYIPFVHDLIPIITPQYCVKELTQEFIEWVLGVFHHADFFLVNSNATKRDLLKVAGILGHEMDSQDVAVIPLDAQFRDPDQQLAPLRKLREWQLAPGEFALMVSTIEVRKNHAAAFEAWLALIDKHGIGRVPKLVCVGKRGWLDDAVYAQIEASPHLRSRVIILSGLSDEELGLLYSTCRFTLYPSHYEGWGLPVTESLCYGKVPLLPDNSSLPEAGGPFAVYYKSGSIAQLTEKAEMLMFDDAERARLEEKIRAEFRPRKWQDIADQIGREIESFVKRTPAPTPGNDGEMVERIAPVRFGAYYPIGRSVAQRIWRGSGSAEIYRSGTGWWWMEPWGCWTKGEGGDIALRFVDQKGPVRGFVRLHAPPGEPTRFEISAPAAGLFVEGTLAAGEFQWVALDIPEIAPVEGFHIRFRSVNPADLGKITDGNDTRTIAIGVGGFYFCHADDLIARANFIEAMSIGGLSQIAFNREPAGGGTKAAD